MFIVGAAIGTVRDSVTDRPAALPEVAAEVLVAAPTPVPSTTAFVTESAGGESTPVTSEGGSRSTAEVSTSTGVPPTTLDASTGRAEPAGTTMPPETAPPATEGQQPDPPPTTTRPPEPTTTTTTTAAPPPTTTTTTVPPTTTTTVVPLGFETHWLEGGWVRIGFRPDEVYLDGAGANPGFIVDVEHSGPEQVEVDFKADHHESDFQAKWEDEGLRVEIEESPAD